MSAHHLDDDIPPNEQWLLEGGDDCWEDLLERVVRCMGEAPAGAVIEIVSWRYGIEVPAAAWCTEAGHRMLRVLREGPATRLWMEKGTGACYRQ